MKKSIEDITKQHGRYDPEAIKFVYEGLGLTVRHSSKFDAPPQADPMPDSSSTEKDTSIENPESRIETHVTGRQLAEGLRDLALARWGRLARVVLEHWGVKTTRDFGEIVYLMIKHHWMTSQTSDRIEDFDNVYDFKTAFEDQFKFELPDQIT